MATYANETDQATDEIVKRCRAAVRIEMRANDRQLLANFRNAFLQWVNDDVSSEFLRNAGTPDTVALEEVAATGAEHSAKTLRVEVIWDANRGIDRSASTQIAEPSATQSVSLSPPANAVSPVSAESKVAEDPQFVFFPDPPEADPIYRDVHGPLQAATDTRTTRAKLVRAPTSVILEPLPPGWRGFDVRTRAAYAAAKRGASRLLEDPRLPGAVVLGAPAAILMLSTLVYVALRTAPEPAASANVTVASSPASHVESNRLAMQVREERVSNRSLLPPSGPVRESEKADRPPVRSATPSSADRHLAVSVLSPPSVAPIREAEKTAPTSGRSPQHASTTPTISPSAARQVSTTSDDLSAIAPKAVAARSPMSFVVGTLVVNSEPQGAEVLINGVPQGRTPLRIPGVNAGSRVVRLELAGYEHWSWAVRVVANRQTPLVVKLQPATRRQTN